MSLGESFWFLASPGVGWNHKDTQRQDSAKDETQPRHTSNVRPCNIRFMQLDIPQRNNHKALLSSFKIRESKAYPLEYPRPLQYDICINCQRRSLYSYLHPQKWMTPS